MGRVGETSLDRTASRSQTCATSPRACETTGRSSPRWRCAATISWSRPRTVRSSPSVGSSRTSRSGSASTAWARREALDHPLAEPGDRFVGTVRQAPAPSSSGGHAGTAGPSAGSRQVARELQERDGGQIAGNAWFSCM